MAKISLAHMLSLHFSGSHDGASSFDDPSSPKAYQHEWPSNEKGQSDLVFLHIQFFQNGGNSC